MPGDRKAREVELASLLEETLSRETTAHWMALLEQAGVVAGPIYEMDQVYQDPQVRDRNMLVDFEDPDLGTLHNIGIPSETIRDPRAHPAQGALLGEHSREVLLEFGFSEAGNGRLGTRRCSQGAAVVLGLLNAIPCYRSGLAPICHQGQANGLAGE